LRGRPIGVDIELFDFKYLVGIFWEKQDGKWNGVIKENITNGEFRVIRNEKMIILIQNELFLQSSVI